MKHWKNEEMKEVGCMVGLQVNSMSRIWLMGMISWSWCPKLIPLFFFQVAQIVWMFISNCLPRASNTCIWNSLLGHSIHSNTHTLFVQNKNNPQCPPQLFVFSAISTREYEDPYKTRHWIDFLLFLILSTFWLGPIIKIYKLSHHFKSSLHCFKNSYSTDASKVTTNHPINSRSLFDWDRWD